jgi:predicted ATPase
MKQPAPRLTHLYLENWRNFTRVEASLDRRVLLVGPNASGKSNLLDALRFLHDLACPVGGGFQEAIRRRGGVSRLRCLAARQHSQIAIEVRVGGDPALPDWEYALEFSQPDLQRPSILRERVSRQGADLLRRPDLADLTDPERLTQSSLEQASANREFRELVAFFASLRYFHVIPQLVRERSNTRPDDPFGGDLIEQIAAASETTRHSRLRRILEALRTAVPRLRDLELWKDHRGAPHLRARYDHWRPQGAWQTEDQLSDGTLRLLALLWTALDGHGPLLVEEPELSLHPEVVREVLSMLAGIQRRSGRQFFLSTHSADLVADERIDLSEVLLLVPGEETTAVRHPAALADLRDLLNGTLTPAPADAAVPPDQSQLDLFAGES